MEWNKNIDYYAYLSGLRKWNASYKVFFSMSALITVIAADSLILSIMTILFMTILSCCVGKVKIGDYLRILRIPMAFILMSGIAVIIQFGSGEIYVTKISILQGITISFKAIGAVSCLYLLTLSTPMGEIISVLKKCHVPNLIVELMHFIYRYIFILLEINRKQKDAVRSRLGYSNKRNSLRIFGCEMANLFVMSMGKAEVYYDVLESRGYEGSCLFWEEKKTITGGQIVSLVLYAILAIMTLLLT